MNTRYDVAIIGCGEDGIGGILCRLGRNQLGLGIGKRRVGVVQFDLCPVHGSLGVAHGLLGGTDCLRGGAYGICLGLIEGILGILGRLEGGLVRFVLLGCIRLGVCETRLRLLEVLAGGIGNLIDRVLNGEVVDYINLLFMRFAVFNFADICVCVGVALWVLVIFLDEVHADDAASKEQ